MWNKRFLKAYFVLLLQIKCAFLFSQTTTVYNSSNSGLSNNAVRCITVDTNNVLWVGTDYGLNKFDGSAWTNYHPGNSPLTDYYIRCLKVDSLNRLWIGTLDQGIFIFDGTNWNRIFTGNSGIPDNSIRDIEFGVIPGEIWVATANGLGYFDGALWTNWNSLNSSFFTNNISSVAITPANEKRVGTLNGGLHILDAANNITVYNHFNSGLPDNTAYTVEFDANGFLWMATPSAGLLVHLGGDTWQWYTLANFLFPTNSTNNLIVDDGLVYVSTYDKGLIIFDGNNSAEYNMLNAGFPENFLHCLAKDENGILWLGTDMQGLIRFDQSLSVSESLPDQLKLWPSVLDGGNRVMRVEGLKTNFHYSVVSLQGALLLSGQSGNNTVSVENLRPGFYCLNIFADGLSYSEKFVVVD